MAKRIVVTAESVVEIADAQNDRLGVSLTGLPLFVVWLAIVVQNADDMVALWHGSAKELVSAVIVTAAWVIVTLRFGWLLLWVFAARTTIALTGAELRIARSIGALFVLEKRAYATRAISRLHVVSRVVKLRGRTLTEHVLAFEYEGKPAELGVSLSQEEAEFLLAGPFKRLTVDKKLL